MIKQLEMSLDILKVREQSMYPGQGLDIVKVEGDKEAIHYGYFSNELLVGVVSVFEKDSIFQIRKLAVLPKLQKNGIGRKLLLACTDGVKKETFLNARVNKTSFYEKCGFEKVDGTEFEKNGFTLIKMIYKNK